MIDLALTILAVLGLCISILLLDVRKHKLEVQREGLEVQREGLEGYASDLDNWDTGLKTREVALNGLVRYADRLAALHPELMVQWVVLRREMFAGLDG